MNAEQPKESLADWHANQVNVLCACVRGGLAVLEGEASKACGVESILEAQRHLCRPDPAARFGFAAGEIERVRRFCAETQIALQSLLASLRAEDRQDAPLRLVVGGPDPGHQRAREAPRQALRLVGGRDHAERAHWQSGDTPDCMKRLPAAVAAVRTALAETEELFQAAEPESDAEARYLNASEQLVAALAELEWTPPSESED